jgi:hypothetical protein
MTLQASFEALMLMCFGLAWPVANLRMLRRRCPEGKGLAFTLIILIGYIAGALAKWPSISGLDLLPGVFWLYLANGSSVALNLFLQWHFKRVRASMPALQVARSSSPEGARVG